MLEEAMIQADEAKHMRNSMDEIELVFPTKEHEADAKTYFEEHISYGENHMHGDSGLDVRIHGHIGYGVRPSERGKSYATAMLKLALGYCKKIGLDKVLITCDKSNIASAKTIMRCAGVLKSEELQDDGEILQRYWIDTNE